ncbi:MAG: T9SS C-terminal target domain-containing protein [Ignavibacteriae bacterium]|nr:MAG: T9SS C-terminal target domain-containing protein [Ignavibacteriota bacterium]
MKTFFCLSFFLIIFGISFSQDVISPKYLPLQIGNVWVYDHYILPSFHERIKYKVIGDTVVLGHKFYKTSSPLPFMHILGYNLNHVWLRVDSVNGNILSFKPSSGCNYRPDEIVIDSLASKLNNTFYHCPFFMTRICSDTNMFTLFGQSFKRKLFRYETGYQTPAGYLYNIGLMGSASGSIGETGYNLFGCVINGVVYGDTSTVVGLRKTTSEVPVNFSLNQNYPNPFNPSTKIKFEIPSNVKREMSNVKIVIYDVIGKEITTLVNEQLSPGTYEVEWNASNNPSGVYFYKLHADGFTDTKRMVLVK